MPDHPSPAGPGGDPLVEWLRARADAYLAASPAPRLSPRDPAWRAAHNLAGALAVADYGVHLATERIKRQRLTSPRAATGPGAYPGLDKALGLFTEAATALARAVPGPRASQEACLAALLAAPGPVVPPPLPGPGSRPRVNRLGPVLQLGVSQPGKSAPGALAESSRAGASVRRGQRADLLLGPYSVPAAAEADVPAARRLEREADPFSAFGVFGVTRVAVLSGRSTSGRLNEQAAAAARGAAGPPEDAAAGPGPPRPLPTAGAPRHGARQPEPGM